MLLPIRLVPVEDVRAWSQFAPDIGSDNATEIREYYLPDFGRWKDYECYQPACEQLVEALKREGPAPPAAIATA